MRRGRKTLEQRWHSTELKYRRFILAHSGDGLGHSISKGGHLQWEDRIRVRTVRINNNHNIPMAEMPRNHTQRRTQRRVGRIKLTWNVCGETRFRMAEEGAFE